jgi:hypothetical protein
LALTLAQHAGEVADEPVDGAQAVTPLKDAGQAALVIFGALVGGPNDPAGNLPGFRRDRGHGGRFNRAVAPGLK